MSFTNTLNRLDRLAHLISRRGTGSPKQLAKRLDVSERTLNDDIRLLETWGAEVKYSRSNITYYFTHDVEICAEIVRPKR